MIVRSIKYPNIYDCDTLSTQKKWYIVKYTTDALIHHKRINDKPFRALFINMD